MSDDLSSQNIAAAFVEAMSIAAKRLPDSEREDFVRNVRETVYQIHGYPGREQNLSHADAALLRSLLSDLEARCRLSGGTQRTQDYN